MKQLLVFLALLTARIFAADSTSLRFEQSGFAEDAKDWTVWSTRAEIAPRTWIDNAVSVGEQGSLAVSGNGNIGTFGGWQRKFADIEPGAWYLLTLRYRQTGINSPNWQILPRLDWHQANGRRAGEVDYAYQSAREGDWTRITLRTQAPAAARSVNLQLFLAHAPQGVVWWDDIHFERIPAPGPRPVTIASVNLRPRDTGTPEKSVQRFLETIERAVPAKTDLILLPEGITVVGTRKRYADVAEPIPGPTTAILSEVARKRHTYIATGIYEREGQVAYNTAVLIDREGKLVGKYRKVYLPREEMEQLTPGSDYPVFKTDFGTVGMMICYDVFFADPARGLAANGAEIVLLPIWGGDQTLAKARAIENQIYLVASGYDHPTYIMNPEGEKLAVAPEDGTVAVATIDLNKSLRQTNTNLGDMRNRRPKELRIDVDAVRSLR